MKIKLDPGAFLPVRAHATDAGLDRAHQTGSIVVKLYKRAGLRSYRIAKGDKISQLVILPIITPTLELVDELEPTERGDNGFGSTGR